MRARGWIWATLLAGLAAFGGIRLASGRAVETDLLAMLPETEQNPVAEDAIKSLTRTTSERVILLVRGGDEKAGKDAALLLAKGLTEADAFADVQSVLPPMDPSAVGRFYAPYRFRMAPMELPAQTPAALADHLLARLATPGFTGLSPALDPLGSLGGFLSRLPFSSMRLEVRDDLLAIPSPEGLHILVSAGLKGSAFDPEVQDRTLAALKAAEARTRAAYPSVSILRTGVVLYAADARKSAEREMNLISLLSMLAIFALYVAVFRSLRHFLLGLACVGAGLIAAVAVCLLVFGKLHLLTLVCGSSVLGVSVDYSVLYFAHHLGAGKRWEPRQALARLMPALLLGLGTTMLGYAALLAAPFPGLRQIAVFSVVGLAGAFLTVVWVLPDWLSAPMARRPVLMGQCRRLLTAARGWSNHRLLPWLAVTALVILAFGAALGRVDDDVRGLILPSKALLKDEAKIQELTGLSNAGAFFLVEGNSEGEVLAREESLTARLRAEGMTAVQALSSFVPSPGRQEANLAANRAAAPLLQEAMVKAGFRPEVAAGLRADLDAPPLTVDRLFETTFSAPFRMLWLGRTRRGVASVVYPTGSPDGAALRRAAAGLPGVALVDKPQSVSALLGHFRRLAGWALAGAVLLVGLVLAATYGARSGLRMLAPSVAGMLAALAAGALLGVPVTLFTVMALILVLGFGVDYTVFLKAGDAAGPSALLGVGLASYGTLISYGALALSHTPSLRGFGLTLALGVLVSTLLSFMALGGPRKEPT